MDVKATFTGDDRKAVLASCEYGEDAALRAYEQALGADKDLSEEQFNMIENQRNSLRESHDYIKKIRDHE
jgi:uncharacterized protein (TIGR02284 family)